MLTNRCCIEERRRPLADASSLQGRGGAPRGQSEQDAALKRAIRHLRAGMVRARDTIIINALTTGRGHLVKPKRVTRTIQNASLVRTAVRDVKQAKIIMETSVARLKNRSAAVRNLYRVNDSRDATSRILTAIRAFNGLLPDEVVTTIQDEFRHTLNQLAVAIAEDEPPGGVAGGPPPAGRGGGGPPPAGGGGGGPRLAMGRPVMAGALQGADDAGMWTAPLIVLGCTKDPELLKKFTGKPEHVVNFMFMVAEEVRYFLSKRGLKSLQEAIGRTDLLYVNPNPVNKKATLLEFDQILANAAHLYPNFSTVGGSVKQKIEYGEMETEILGDSKIMDGVYSAYASTDAKAAPVKLQLKAVEKIEYGEMETEILGDSKIMDGVYSAYASTDAKAAPVKLQLKAVESKDVGVHNLKRNICNLDRAFGSRISYERCGEKIADGKTMLSMAIAGHAGQSFNAFLARGISLDIVGDANDYAGKCMSGGRIVVKHSEKHNFATEDNTLIGNVALYGATSGTALIGGAAGERFAVRNSGVMAVVESVGDHGCEYMTGGVVLVLGSIGRNFAAGMSGGHALLFDHNGDLSSKINGGTVDVLRFAEIKKCVSQFVDKAKSLLTLFNAETDSTLGKDILANWDKSIEKLVMIYSKDLRAVDEEKKKEAEAKEEAAMVKVKEVRNHDVDGMEVVLDCDLAILAMRFVGPEKTVIEQLRLAVDGRSNIDTAYGKYKCKEQDKIFAAGDCRRGQSLVVWAIHEGGQAARQVDEYLMGSTTLAGPGGIVLGSYNLH